MKLDIYDDPISVPQQLAALGLRVAPLWNAMMRGQAARANCTPNHPRGAAGLYANFETVSHLRLNLRTEKKPWLPKDDGMLALTVNEDESVRILVATGDEDTGLREGSPCTKSKKGSRTSGAVRSNASLADTLFGDIRPVRLSPEQRKLMPLTWILLFRYCPKTERLFAELSLPTSMSEDDHVDGWAKRIILGSEPVGGDSLRSAPDVPKSPEIEVIVKRRHA